MTHKIIRTISPLRVATCRENDFLLFISKALTMFSAVAFVLSSVIPALAVNQTEPSVYVSLTGTDSIENGATDQPYRSVNYALAQLGGRGRVILKAGDYIEESIDFSKTGDTIIQGENRETVRLLFGRRITAATPVQGFTNVYVAKEVPLKGYDYELWQHDITDLSTEILPSERHDIQRGLTHRLTSTRLFKKTSVQKVEEAPTLAYYFDGTDLYFSKAAGSDLQVNPIVIPVWNYIPARRRIQIENMTFMYRPFIFKSCTGYLRNVSVKYNNYSSIVGSAGTVMTFENCEGAGSHEDGFGYNYDAKCREINCWAHSNLDEGSSAHETVVIHRIGGLYEKNICGVTDVGSATTICDGVSCINNTGDQGFIFTYYRSGTNDTGSAILTDCIGGTYRANLMPGGGSVDSVRVRGYGCSGTLTANKYMIFAEKPPLLETQLPADEQSIP